MSKICKGCTHHRGSDWEIICVHPIQRNLPVGLRWRCRFRDTKNSSGSIDGIHSSNNTVESSSWFTPEPSCYGGSSNTDSDDTFKSGGGGDFGGGGSSGDW